MSKATQLGHSALASLRNRWRRSSAYRVANSLAIWLRDKGLNLTTGVKVSLGAIGLTIMGDTFFEVLRNLPGSPSHWLPWNWGWNGRMIWHVLLVFAVFSGACWKFEDFIKIFHRPKGDSAGSTAATDLENIETPDALIVFVSVTGKDKGTGEVREPAYEASVRRLILDKQQVLSKKQRHVYLMHSEETESIAKEYLNRKAIKDNAYLTVHIERLKANFSSAASCHTVCKSAIERARAQAKVESVVIDITGGTKPASSAAVLAGLDLDVGLCYIEHTEHNPIKGVDVEWRRANSA